jgi:arylsulfatase A-like enzyme
MERRNFLRTVGIGVVVLATGTFSGCQRKLSKQPNIIFILADDLGYGDLSCLNPESKISTPNLDRLAGQGIIFTDAHSGSAVCSPTRYGLLTGRYSWRSRLKSSVLWAWDEPLIETDRLTVGDFLQQHGYTTACVGKWHLGWDWQTTDGSRMNEKIPIGKWDLEHRVDFGKKVDFSLPIQNGPITKGFDTYFGDDVPNFPPYCFIENDRTVGLPTENKPENMFGSPGPMMNGWDLEKVMPTLTQKSVDFISADAGAAPFHKKAGSPFFLYFSLTAPHTPIAPSDHFEGKSQAGLYGDDVQQVDWTVGQIMKALERTGQTENTLLIFSSDNGSPGRDGTNMSGPVSSVKRFGHNPSYIYRGTKADIWEGGHRIPFIASWPGKIKPGISSNETICLTDFFVTCAAILGEKLPENVGEDSFNILPALLSENYKTPIREAVVHHSIQGMFAIRQGEWKLIEGKGSGGWSKDGKEDPASGQLYNIVEDPGEKNNLYQNRPEIVFHLASLLEKFRKENRSRPIT